MYTAVRLTSVLNLTLIRHAMRDVVFTEVNSAKVCHYRRAAAAFIDNRCVFDATYLIERIKGWKLAL